MNCPKCNNVFVVRNGLANTKIRGDIQRWLCKNCGYRFRSKNAHKLWFRPTHVKYALDLSNQGLSLREIELELYKKYQINVSHATVSNWIKYYVANAKEVENMNDYTVHIKGEDLEVSFQIKSEKEAMITLVNRLIKRAVITKKLPRVVSEDERLEKSNRMKDYWENKRLVKE